MYWNEKIDWIKKNYSSEEFSIPAAHLDRKEILRKVETKFISRPEEYYELNNFTPRYSNWWENIRSGLDLTIESNPYTFINSVIEPNKPFWIACELTSGVLIYKANLSAILCISSIGRTWTHTFHVIQLKYEYMISVKFEDTKTRIKVTGSKEIESKIKQAATLH